MPAFLGEPSDVPRSWPLFCLKTLLSLFISPRTCVFCHVPWLSSEEQGVPVLGDPGRTSYPIMTKMSHQPGAEEGGQRPACREVVAGRGPDVL